jgi:EAL domain-containing protein (putative c-di-GMP-specific phosphodiesterase class I)
MRSAEFGLPSKNITVEFSELSAICSFEKFQDIISTYKNLGFSIAFDDINCALSDIKKISGINPDYIKVGGRLVRGIETDIDKRIQLDTVITIAKMIKAKVIAVGVETSSELEMLYSMGIDAAQGNLIGLPQKEFKGISEQAKNLIAILGT